MIHVDKTNTVPKVLNDTTTIKNFEKNIKAKKFVGSERYRKIRDELTDLYNNKCAYCEKYCDSTHIEHYRPKSIYFWLAYSWDNLLLSCPECNSNKRNIFKINNNKRADYKSEPLEELHNKISQYDNYEKPKLLNPEQLTDKEFKEHFTFDTSGSIVCKTEEMKHTIEVCDLNRDFLIKKRIAILNEYREYLNLSPDKTKQLKIIVKKLENSIRRNEEYIAWKLFLLNIIKRLG